MVIAQKDEVVVRLADTFAGNLKSCIVLFGLDQGGDSRDDFQEIFGSHLAGAMGKLKKLAGKDSSRAAHHFARVGAREAGGGFFQLVHAEEVLILFQPLLVTGMTPEIEILAFDRLARETSGQDFFDGWQIIEPEEKGGSRATIEDAMVELIAEVVGDTGDFADFGHKLVRSFELGTKKSELRRLPGRRTRLRLYTLIENQSCGHFSREW